MFEVRSIGEHTWLGLAPPALRDLFERRSHATVRSTRQASTQHGSQLVDPLGLGDFWNRSALLSRSVDGLVRAYNRLPVHVVSHCCVSNFQSDITARALEVTALGADLEDICSLCFI